MNLREHAAWMIAATCALGWIVSERSFEHANVASDVCAGHLQGCTHRVQELEKFCSAEGAAAMERAVQLFQCQTTMCESTGWYPPSYWEEAKQEMMADPEFRTVLERRSEKDNP